MNFNYIGINTNRVYIPLFSITQSIVYLLRLKNIFYKFLWNSGHERINRSIGINDFAAGGLRMININMLVRHSKSFHFEYNFDDEKSISWLYFLNRHSKAPQYVYVREIMNYIKKNVFALLSTQCA